MKLYHLPWKIRVACELFFEVCYVRHRGGIDGIDDSVIQIILEKYMNAYMLVPNTQGKLQNKYNGGRHDVYAMICSFAT